MMTPELPNYKVCDLVAHLEGVKDTLPVPVFIDCKCAAMQPRDQDQNIEELLSHSLATWILAQDWPRSSAETAETATARRNTWPGDPLVALMDLIRRISGSDRLCYCLGGRMAVKQHMQLFCKVWLMANFAAHTGTKDRVNFHAFFHYMQ